MLDKVVLRLTELLKEKNIIDKNEKDIDKIVNLLSKKTSIPLNTLTNIIYKKSKTIQLDCLYQLCRELNIDMVYFFDSNLFY